MRASLRFAFVFFWLALLLLAAGLTEHALAQTPTETPAAAASGAGAPADPGFTAWAEEKKAPIESINTLLLEAVKFVVLVGGLFVAVWAVIWLIWRRPHELVLASMANATGDEETNAVAESLSVLMRIELVTQLERLHEHMRRYSQRADPRALPLPRLPLPAETPNERVKTLIDAVAEAAPDEGQPFIKLLNTVLPSRGKQIAMTLLRDETRGGVPGLVVEITDLSGAPIGNRQIITGLPATPDVPLAQQYAALLDPAARWLAHKLTEMELLRPTWRIPREWRPDYEARVRYVLGLFKAADGRRGEQYTFFFDEAIADCERAKKCARRHWYGPDKCIADTRLERLQSRAGRNNSSAATERELDAVLTHYATARSLLEEQRQQTLLRKAWRLVAAGEAKAATKLIRDERLAEAAKTYRGPVRRDEPEWTEVQLASARKVIEISEATAWAHLADPGSIAKAKAQIDQLWATDLFAEPHEVVLYDLAIWYAVMAGHTTGRERIDSILRARRFLVCGMARDRARGYWRAMAQRHEFVPIMAGYETTRDCLVARLRQDPELPGKSGPEFMRTVDEILARSGWDRYERPQADDAPLADDESLALRLWRNLSGIVFGAFRGDLTRVPD